MKKKYGRVYIEITNVCNKSCSFCPGTKRAARFVEREEFKEIIEKIKHLTDYVYLHVMGEPLLHPDLPQLIDIAKNRGMKVAITTNGTLLPEVGEALILHGVYKVNISVHSFEDGSREDYLSYIDGCSAFADKASDSGVLTTLRLWNKGVDEGRNIDTVAILHEKFVGDWIYGPRGARIRHKLHLEEGERFDWPDMSAPDYGERVFCHGLGDHFAILSDGTVVPCCLDREGNIPLGNIFEEDIDSILTSERALGMCMGFSKKRATEELCRRCGYARRFKI